MRRPVLVLSFALVAAVAGLLGVLAGGSGALSVHGRALAAASPAPSFADVVASANPAVVHITAIQGDPTAEDPGVVTHHPGGTSVRRGEGTGFIVDSDGYILTNHHLVSSPQRIRVRLADRREFTATLVGSDPSTDLALLKVKATSLPSIKMGDSDRLRVGEWVCAIGNPYRFEHSVTVGVVSSKGRKIYNASFDAYIQTDAAINPGNSGGPLINAAGEAIGINSAVSMQGQGIGFAVPINVAKDILGALRTQGHVSRGYLGIQLQDFDPDLQALIKTTEDHGAVVLDTLPGEAGEKAGLKRYDVITEVAGARVDDGDSLVHRISSHAPGTTVALTVVRDGRKLQLQAKLAERAVNDDADDDDDDDDWEQDHSAQGDAFGLVTAELTAQKQHELDVPEDRRGVVVKEVVGLSPDVDVLAEGDVIVEVNRHPTPRASDYRKVLSSLRDGQVAWLFVYRPRPEATFLAKVDVEKKPEKPDKPEKKPPAAKKAARKARP
ncbi:MAG TPA: trypsin-like peptidase domain-containing protein [Vicinamibacteria bacterium]|nr:trypsin-like peptidase domain-containing protein [Vicinamibacteria bacterium]